MSRERVPGEDDEPRGDLTHLDEEFAAAPKQSRETIPDGRYVVRVMRVDLTTTRRTGQPVLRWMLRILEPAFVGRVLWRQHVLATAGNLRWVKSDLSMCGLELERLSDLPSRLDHLRGVELHVAKRTHGGRETVYFNRRYERHEEARRGG